MHVTLPASGVAAPTASTTTPAPGRTRATLTPGILAPDHVARTAAGVPDFGTDVAATLHWAVEQGRTAPITGDTTALWELLAETARLDVGAARILEPHLDALGILAQARASGIDTEAVQVEVDAGTEASWGVFAAEGPGVRLRAHRDTTGWRLDGTKPWCSLASRLTHALVTAWVSDSERRLFAVDLRAASIRPHAGPWVSRGLSQVVSAPVDFDDAPAAPVGEAGWYQTRPGFAWGGMGVAAVWWGGSIPLRDALADAAARDDADQLAFTYAGSADAELWAARAVLAEAARAIDAGEDTAPAVLAARVRAVTARAVESVLDLADRALGPRPLTADEEHARRVSDLRVYVRQHHAERDLARLGRLARR